MIKAVVEIRLKPGVLDAQGKAIEGVLDQYDVEGIEQVRVGKLVELRFATDKDIEAQVETLCEKLLVNHEMEDYHYTIEECGDE
ncbi:phosphoribosylformylglycinamidine synthase subunit PurS [Amphibacillus xylanus]|uniref:Phosphoribosylformylglycinamidine synthase subunit PurS n=1 Tax=Amphibacillus xylanus (strain ATCC 51415 / DSM 6626 / JCM 7361 / LMG 17667 / NBRC 15112 / Ep01) TaxID=698758 RepID=K0J046_AMPXN|nr:phosphoribosylformylglycinamidine synthase subunit PurS [Amphibacillus xylanus]BAM46562.1 phosphoribosylformylglycinamidine synthase PurS [Amphibacillus xylanus NBRC 15112]